MKTFLERTNGGFEKFKIHLGIGFENNHDKELLRTNSRTYAPCTGTISLKVFAWDDLQQQQLAADEAAAVQTAAKSDQDRKDKVRAEASREEAQRREREKADVCRSTFANTSWDQWEISNRQQPVLLAKRTTSTKNLDAYMGAVKQIAKIQTAFRRHLAKARVFRVRQVVKSVPPDFQKVDLHACKKTPSIACQNPEVLSSYLTSPAFVNSELMKYRVIFRWITENISYNAKAFLSGQSCDCTAEGSLQNRTTVCSGYSRLFSAIAKHAGLRTVNIMGISKGYGSVPGQDYTGHQGDHEWNAVCIGGKWQLLDVTWAAGSLDGDSFVRKFSESNFLPSAEQFGTSHFPLQALS